MLAYADGKDIEFCSRGKWFTIPFDEEPKFDWSRHDYRIKPTPTYRPFANAEECWEEMKKHEPFGWLRGPRGMAFIAAVTDDGVYTGDDVSFDEIFHVGEFADGSVFGKLTEEK